MIFKFSALLFSLSLFALNTACVSVNLANNDVKRADDIKFKAPNGSFQEFKSELVDKGWRHKSNGNAISFVSDCQNQYDPTLKNIEAGVINSITSKKKVSSDLKTFNSRESLHSVYDGKVDGIPTTVELVTFKKNGCIYVISYVAVKSNYAENKPQFQSFLDGFRAP